MTLEFSANASLGPFAYDASFDAHDEVVVLFGHSGAGKSVTLQLVSGLMRPQRGRIVIGDKTVFDSDRGINLPPQNRQLGYVVQELALFPHMSARENIGFALPHTAATTARVLGLMELLEIRELAERRPNTLSGGQRQRVALARALARESTLLLLDEPFSALDESLRITLRRELLQLRRSLGLTIVFVTHDLREAHLMADRIAVFDGGRLLQFAARETVFRRPNSSRVAHLTGIANVRRGVVRSVSAEELLVEVNGLRLRCGSYAEGSRASPGDFVDVAIRSERVVIRRGGIGAENTFSAAIAEEFAYGTSHTLLLQPTGAGPTLEAELAARPYEVLVIPSRREWTVELPAKDLHVMPAAN